MDEAYLKHHMFVRPKLELLPSEFFRRQGFASFQEDKVGLDLASGHDLVDNFLWANDYPHPPCYVLGAVSGSQHRAGASVHNEPLYASSNLTTVAPRLYEMAQLSPSDVDVVQSYENFTGGVVMALVEHGFCRADEVNDFFRVENLVAPGGRLPLNTSGGNLAEGYMHGLGLTVEAVRQIRGRSTNQVPGADVSLMTAGPMVTPVSSCVFGSEATL
jgi:acetyl-CoA acetyltransferase